MARQLEDLPVYFLKSCYLSYNHDFLTKDFKYLDPDDDEGDGAYAQG